MIIGDMEIRLRADIARLQRDMDDARRVVGGAMDGIARAAALAKGALAGIAAGLSLGALAHQVIDAQREFDKLNASLITATGSTANAAGAFKALQAFAATTPYSVAEATEAFIKMRNLGLDPSEKALRSYGNTAAAMGKGLNQMVEAVADAATGEFERLKEFGITAKQNGDRVALTFKGMTSLIGNNATEIQGYLRKLGETDFAGAMDRRADTLDGAISNLKDAWDGLLLKVSQSGLGDAARGAVAKLSDVLGSLGDRVGQLSGALTTGAKVGAAYIGAFVVAPAAFSAAATAIGTLQVQLALARMEMASGASAASLFSVGLGGVTVSAQLAAGALGKLKVAAGVLFAAFAGWEIGTYLSENFVEARVAGLAFVGATLKGWESVKYGAQMAWEEIGFAWDKTIGTMKEGFATFLSGVASGLSLVGAKDTSKDIQAYADQLRSAAAAQGTFAERTAGMTAAHKAAMDQIDDNIVELVQYEMTTKKVADTELGQYQVRLSADEKRKKAKLDILEIENRLNGVNGQTAGELAKLKVALDAGAISQQEYAKYTAKINKEARENSTVYKDAVKQIDLQTEALKRQAAARAFDNQQLQLQLGFLNRTGQLNGEDFINKGADADIKAMRDQIEMLEKQKKLEGEKIENKSKVLELKGQIDQANKDIDAREVKRENDLFEQEQQRYRLAVNNTADLIEAAQAQAKAQQDQTREQQDYIDALGMTGMQLAELTAARLRDQAAQLDRKAEIAIIEEQTAAYRAQAEELRKQAGLAVSAERLKEQQEFWGDVERTAHDTFVSIADGGKDAFTRLKESAKNIFFEWLYQMTLKKWVINIGAATDGAGAVAGLQSGSSLLTQGGSILGAASNLYSTLTGGMTAAGGLGTGFMGSLAGGLDGVSAGASATRLGLTSNFGVSIGNSIADVVGPQIAGALSSGLGAIATALPWIGGALAVAGLAKAAFGHGPREYTSSTLTGSIGTDGFSGAVNNAWKEKGGWFSSDRHGVDSKAADPALAAGLTSTYQVLKDATGSYAKVLGLNADSIANRTQAISIALGKDEAANQKAIADFFAGVGDQLAKELAPDLDKFAKSGESASAVLQRLASDFQVTDQVAQLLGSTGEKLFGSSGMQSAAAREQLIGAAGGLAMLTQQAQAFSENFLTDAEKLAPVATALDKGLSSLGLSTIPTTRDEFKALVQDMIASGAAATETGASQLASLLAYSDAFAKVHPQIDAAAEAAEKAAAAMQAMKDSASTLFAGVNDAFGALQRVVDREKSAVQVSIKAQTAAVENLQSLSQALHGALDSYSVPDDQMASRARAQAEIRANLAITRAGGSLSAGQVDSLKKALSVVTQDASSQFSSYYDYVRDLAQTKSDIAQLAGVTDDSLSVEQRSLAALQDQLQRLDDIVANGQAQLDALHGQSVATLSLAQAMAAFQSSIGSAQANPVVSGTATIAGFYQDLLGRAPDQAGLQYWLDALAKGNSLDAIRSGFMDGAEYKARQKRLGIPGFANGGDFAGGLRAVGEVGVEIEATGPSRIHSTQSIVDALRNPSSNSEALVAEIKLLRVEVKQLREANSAENRAIAKGAQQTGEILDKWDASGQPQTRTA
jgi:hypothetical protein